MSMIEVVYGEVDPLDVIGKRGYAYECPYPVEIGGTVEVPGTGGDSFPQLATVVSLRSDYTGEPQMVMRTMPSRVVHKRLKDALVEIHGWLADVETSSLTVEDVATRVRAIASGALWPQGAPVATLTGELGELVNVDAPPRAVCSQCGRKTWADGQACLMTQPDGSTCPGTFVPVDEEPW